MIETKEKKTGLGAGRREKERRRSEETKEELELSPFLEKLDVC